MRCEFLYDAIILYIRCVILSIPVYSCLCLMCPKKPILRAVVSRGKPIFKEISELTDLYYKSYTREKFVISIEHRCFFDTGIFRVPQIFRPNWIGTVRDPVDRYASIYYYRSKPLKERPPWLQLVIITLHTYLKDQYS